LSSQGWRSAFGADTLSLKTTVAIIPAIAGNEKNAWHDAAGQFCNRSKSDRSIPPRNMQFQRDIAEATSEHSKLRLEHVQFDRMQFERLQFEHMQFEQMQFVHTQFEHEKGT